MNSLKNFLETSQMRKYHFNKGVDIENFNDEISPFVFPDFLKEVYGKINGGNYEDLVFVKSNFLSIQEAVYQYSNLKNMFKNMGLDWPSGLFPISEYNSIYFFIVLDKNGQSEPKIYSCDIGSGDLCLELEFNSLHEMLELAVFSSELDDVYLKKQREICPDSYDVSQKSNKSTNSFVNSYELLEIHSLPKIWFS